MKSLNDVPTHLPLAVVLENIAPAIEGGRFPVKREVGDTLTVTVDAFREGHDAITVLLQHRLSHEPVWHEQAMTHVGNDQWTATLTLTENARYRYRVVAFPDIFGSWRDEIIKKRAANMDIPSELLEGLAILEQLSAKSSGEDSGIPEFLDRFRQADSQDEQASILLSSELQQMADVALDRSGIETTSTECEVVVDRVKARSAAWYELFPRSAGNVPGVSGTFDDVIARLDDIEQMGFDVLYFPPIHPIGEINRKGRNNAVTSLPGDPGSPYAIGSALGGHDAIEPSLGTFEDFRRLVEAATDRGIEIALDFAINVAPDHPWPADHPDWFHVRPDGTIKFAENPPKKYEDIYPINFAGEDWQNLWIELRRILLFWVDQGVTTFRVDNPHTKPFALWEWLIREVQTLHPEVIFLSEAFTRPKIMKRLAKCGFTQSYTYFTWRNNKSELIDYFEELTNPPVSDYMRGNLFPTTPDILPTYLQDGGPPAFKIRLTLAATLSSVYGMYSGFEVCEATPVPGKEEFLNSEKYEVKTWDWDRPGNIRLFVARLNQIRREHPALQEYDNLTFFWSANDNILCYGKVDGTTGDGILVVVNLNPFSPEESMIYVPSDHFKLPLEGEFPVVDLVIGQTYHWAGVDHLVRLDPDVEPVHVFWMSGQGHPRS
ncbi:alpha-1,4-glucan--maltose-1-phosphate maltosyltransferase [soil metagenome]